MIEATEPLPYVATRPDPLTVVVEFRNVDGQSVTKKSRPDRKSPIASVTVENADALGAPSSRVRIVLAEAGRASRPQREEHRSSSISTRATAKSAPYVLPPASRRSSGAGQSLDAATPATGAADPISALSLQTLAGRGGVPGQPAAPPSAATSPTALPSAAPPARSAALAVQAPAQAPATPPPASRFTGTPISLDFEDADLQAVLALFPDEERSQHRDRPRRDGHGERPRLRTCRGTRRSTSSCARTSSATSSTARSSASRRSPCCRPRTSSAKKLTDAQAHAGRPAHADQDAQLREGRRNDAAAGQEATRCRSAARSQFDPRTNTLIITDLRPASPTATDLITTLDKPQPQVEIEARIVQTNKNYAKALGVQWGFDGRVDPRSATPRNLAFPNSGALAGAAAARPANGRAATAVNLAAAGRHERRRARARLGERRLQPRRRADARSKRRGNGRVLSTPRVLDAEQRRSGNHAGHADSDSDRREQHRDRHVQGRGAHA